MADLEQQLGDLLADGKITDEDADTVRTFAQFLREAGPSPVVDQGVKRFPAGHPLATREARAAWAARWMPYMQGQTDGPIEATEVDGA